VVELVETWWAGLETRPFRWSSLSRPGGPASRLGRFGGRACRDPVGRPRNWLM